MLEAAEPWKGTIPHGSTMTLPWHIAHLDLESTWAHTKGAGVRVAILDGGFADVAGLRGPRVSRLDERGLPTAPDDPSGHGTAVASVLGSDLPDAPGIAPEVSILAYCVHDTSDHPVDHRVSPAIEAAVAAEVDLISCSFTLPEITEDLHRALVAANAAGIPVFVAAGNDPFETAQFPEALPSLIAVGACDWYREPMPDTRYGPWTDIFAPGQDITVIGTDGALRDDFGYTSAATPIVAGVAALSLAYASIAGGASRRAWVKEHLESLLPETGTASDSDPAIREVSATALFAKIRQATA